MIYTARWSSKFQIKEKSWVFIPTDETIKYGIAVKKSIEKKWTPPQIFYHLRNGGHVEALKSHLNHKYFLRLDIENFFGCINKSRVTRSLKGYFSYEDARDIAINSTVRLPCSTKKIYILPFGFVQSPIIASLALYNSKLGKYLHKINELSANTVSIYMDDIIISSNDKEYLENELSIVNKIAEISRFTLNKDKIEGPAEKITVFNIEISHKYLLVKESRFELFKEAYCNTKSENVRRGILSYTSSVNIGQSTILWEIMNT